jgi:O-antigen chain-terminating methyltransferase
MQHRDTADIAVSEILEALECEAAQQPDSEYLLENGSSQSDLSVSNKTPQGQDKGWAYDDPTLWDFLVLPDTELVTRAYLFFLGREPDRKGYEAYLAQLKKNRFGVFDVLGGLMRSREGKRRNKRLAGLCPLFWLSRLTRVPVIGPLALFLAAPILFPFVCTAMVQIPKRMTCKGNAMHQGILGRIEQESEQRYQLAATLEERVVQETFAREKFAEQILLGQEETSAGLKRLGRDLQAVRRTCLENQRRVQGLAFRSISTESVDAPPPPVSDEDASYDLEALYISFEDEFRGTRQEIKDGCAVYLDLVSRRESPVVLDVGCGRGEWLELLGEHGIRAMGVDANHLLVDEGRAMGLDMHLDDGIAFLAAQHKGVANVITSFHLIEHLPVEKMVAFIDEAVRVLSPGGMLIFETPNPRNVLVGSGDFYRDPTHRNPVFPDTLRFVCEQRGCIRGEIFWIDRENSTLIPAEGYRFDTLDDYVRVPRDYCYIGYV